MIGTENSISRVLILAAFAAVASSAGLQWVAASAQAEASRQAASRHTLAEFSSLLSQYERVPGSEKEALNASLAGKAQQLTRVAANEPLAEGSRRVQALTSYQSTGDRELQARLKAEVHGLLSQAENMETAALGRAEWVSTINAILLGASAVLSGLAALQLRRTRPGVS